MCQISIAYNYSSKNWGNTILQCVCCWLIFKPSFLSKPFYMLLVFYSSKLSINSWVSDSGNFAFLSLPDFLPVLDPVIAYKKRDPGFRCHIRFCSWINHVFSINASIGHSHLSWKWETVMSDFIEHIFSEAPNWMSERRKILDGHDRCALLPQLLPCCWSWPSAR